MDEENNFLKEQKETVAADVCLVAETPRTPVEDFGFWLRGLSNCGFYRGNYVSLNHVGADVLAADADKAFQSKVKCQDKAQERVDKAIREAQQKMETRMSVSGSNSFFQEFQRQFDHRLNVLREKLEMLHTAENTPSVKEIEGCLVASEIHRKAKEICGGLSAKYSLQPASTYYSEISYDVWDTSDYETGLAKLVAKCFMRHGFNC